MTSIGSSLCNLALLQTMCPQTAGIHRHFVVAAYDAEHQPVPQRSRKLAWRPIAEATTHVVELKSARSAPATADRYRARSAPTNMPSNGASARAARASHSTRAHAGAKLVGSAATVITVPRADTGDTILRHQRTLVGPAGNLRGGPGTSRAYGRVAVAAAAEVEVGPPAKDHTRSVLDAMAVRNAPKLGAAGKGSVSGARAGGRLEVAAGPAAVAASHSPTKTLLQDIINRVLNTNLRVSSHGRIYGALVTISRLRAA